MPLEAEFILFTHYNEDQQDDFKAFNEGKQAPFAGVERLSRFFEGLCDLLNGSKKGILVLFYDFGWTDALAQIQRGGFLDRQTRRAMEFGKAVREQISRTLRERRCGDLEDRLRVVTAEELLRFFSGVKWELARHLDSWLVGESLKLSYDSPKLVDAVIRLRAIDCGLPVFRIDQDVLFNDLSGREQALGLAEAIARSVQLHDRLRGTPHVSYTMFSCRYRASATLGEEADDFPTWASAFATRVYPALLATAVESQSGPDVNAAFRRPLAQKFYGFRDDHAVQESGLWRIGAHPLRAVVSGALLYLSPGAILDLPPFSNFSFKVMWVDDHLKYLLHRTLGHFVNYPDDPWDAERPEVHKGRPAIHGLAKYVYGDYIPTVFWGCILDAWIQKNANVKLSSQEIARLYGPAEPLPHGTPGPLAEDLRFALWTGQLDRRSRAELYKKLRESALKRIELVQEEWLSLESGADDGVSCASAWVQGLPGRRGWTGLAAGLLKDGRGVRGRPEDFERLNDAVRDGLDKLMIQAMSYIDWTLNWPKVIQTIRALPPGAFVGDVEFKRRD